MTHSESQCMMVCFLQRAPISLWTFLKRVNKGSNEEIFIVRFNVWWVVTLKSSHLLLDIYKRVNEDSNKAYYEF